MKRGFVILLLLTAAMSASAADLVGTIESVDKFYGHEITVSCWQPGSAWRDVTVRLGSRGEGEFTLPDIELGKRLQCTATDKTLNLFGHVTFEMLHARPNENPEMAVLLDPVVILPIWRVKLILQSYDDWAFVPFAYVFDRNLQRL